MAKSNEELEGKQETKTATKKQTKSKNIDGTELVKETKSMLVFKATKPLTKAKFDLLSDMVKSESDKTGLKIVLMPNSVELVEDN